MGLALKSVLGYEGVVWQFCFLPAPFPLTPPSKLSLPSCRFQVVPSKLSLPSCRFHVVASTLSLPRCRFHVVASTLSLPRCRFHVVASTLSLPRCRFHVVASKLSLSSCRFQVVASTWSQVKEDYGSHVDEVRVVVRSFSSLYMFACYVHTSFSSR